MKCLDVGRICQDNVRWQDKDFDKVKGRKIMVCEVVESHLQTNATGTELGTLSCRAIRQMTRSKLNDNQKLIRKRWETWVMAGAEPGITNHVGYTGNLTYISSRISLVFPPQRYHHSDPCTAVCQGRKDEEGIWIRNLAHAGYCSVVMYQGEGWHDNQWQETVKGKE